MAEQASGEGKARLERIAAAFRHIPMEPPRNLFEACQMFWLAFCFNGVDSPGRLDQFLGSYYEAASEEVAS
jgi:pyruvate-formate lyase